MKRIFIYLILLVVSPISVFAQHLEVGMNLGAANYWGDIAPSIAMKETHVAYGFFARINMSSSFAFTGSINNMSVSGDDKNFEYNKLRNINFNTDITEYSGTLEFNFMKFGVDVLDKKFSPYVFIGLAFTQFDPTANNGGITIHLRNIQTENKSYGSTVTSMPWGMGFKWQFHRHFAAEANVNFRRVFSDYLDDVSTVYTDYTTNVAKKGIVGATAADPSTHINSGNPLFSVGQRRGNSDYSDWYVTSTVSVSYRFYKRTKCRRFY